MCDYMITLSEFIIFILVFKWRVYISSVLKYRVFAYSECLNKTIIILKVYFKGAVGKYSAHKKTSVCSFTISTTTLCFTGKYIPHVYEITHMKYRWFGGDG